MKLYVLFLLLIVLIAGCSQQLTKPDVQLSVQRMFCTYDPRGYRYKYFFEFDVTNVGNTKTPNAGLIIYPELSEQEESDMASIVLSLLPLESGQTTTITAAWNSTYEEEIFYYNIVYDEPGKEELIIYRVNTETCK